MVFLGPGSVDLTIMSSYDFEKEQVKKEKKKRRQILFISGVAAFQIYHTRVAWSIMHSKTFFLFFQPGKKCDGEGGGKRIQYNYRSMYI